VGATPPRQHTLLLLLLLLCLWSLSLASCEQRCLEAIAERAASWSLLLLLLLLLLRLLLLLLLLLPGGTRENLLLCNRASRTCVTGTHVRECDDMLCHLCVFV